MRRLAYLVLALSFAGCEAFETPENITISIDAPTTVSADQEFDVVLTVSNTASASQQLVDVDVADEWLEGIVIAGMDPDFKDSFHVPVDNTQSYNLDLSIPPGGSVTVTISAMAAHAGDWAGDIDFCINSSISCLSRPVRTIVR